MKKKVKVVIIGAGSAGLSALGEVKRQTENYLLVNHGPMGTSCARTACMPTKTLVEVSRAYSSRQFLKEMGGVGIEDVALNIPETLAYVKRLRDFFVEGNVKNTLAEGEKLINARAQFLKPNLLQVGSDTIEAECVIIATGTRPRFPKNYQNFGSKVISTDDFFDLDDLPASMAVIGLGPSGLEFAQALHRLGVRIVGIDKGERLAGLTDPMVRDTVRDILDKEFSLLLNQESHPAHRGDELILHAGGRKIQVEKILLSMGRTPNLDDLGLENLDIDLDERGIPRFNPETMQIGDLPLFIAGDVNGYRPILHEAIDEGHIAGFNAVRSTPTCFRRRVPLAITYTEPHIARIGASFEELGGQEIVVGQYDFSHQSRARMNATNKGLLRVYLNHDDGMVLGAELAAPEGEHLAHLLAWAIQRSMTVFDLLQLPFYHPAVEEGLRSALRDGMHKLSQRPREQELLFCRSRLGW